jgi:chaperone modulatory protein CbpM
MSPRRIRARPTHAVARDDEKEPLVELTVVARQAGVRVSLVRRYLAFGLIDPSGGTGEAPLFAPSCAARVAAAERMRRDLGLDFAGAVVACELLDRIHELQQRVGSGSGGGRLP